MPMPMPSAGESRDDFVSRFMSSKAMMDEYPTQKQRLAVAFSQWRRKHGGGKVAKSPTAARRP